jgi:DNA polymerase-3 subunit epsilon
MPDIEKDQKDAARRAHLLLQKDPATWCIFDCETTDLHGVVCEIGVIAPDGTTLFQSLINPECEVSEGARAKHGITDEELRNAPILPDIWEDLWKVLEGRDFIVTYNAGFDYARITQSASRYKLPMPSNPKQKWGCAMALYAQFAGEWSAWHSSYKWQPLGGNHRAIGDCLACLEKIKEMAAEFREEARNA